MYIPRSSQQCKMVVTSGSYCIELTNLLMRLLCIALWFTSIIEALPFPTASLNHKRIGLRNKTTNSITLWDCPDCAPGMGLTVECGEIYDIGTITIACVSCEEDITFSDKMGVWKCKPCRRCTNNEVQLGKCSVYKDNVQCRCKYGYYRDEGTKDCKPCSWCCNGNINHVVKECKKFQHLPPGKLCSFQDAKECAPTPNPTQATERSQQLGYVSSASKTSRDLVIKTNDTEQVEGVLQGKVKDKANTLKKAPPESEPSITLWILAIVSSTFIIGTIMIAIKYRSAIRQRSRNQACQTNQSQETLPLEIITSRPQTSESAGIEESDTLLVQQLPQQQLQQTAATTNLEAANGISKINELSRDQGSADRSVTQRVSLPQQLNAPKESVEELMENKKLLICQRYGPKVEDLPHDVKHEAVLMLNIVDKTNGNDFRKVAEEIGLDYVRRKNLEGGNRMEGVFDVMITQSKTVDDFVDILYKINRVDVVDKMYKMAVKNGSS